MLAFTRNLLVRTNHFFQSSSCSLRLPFMKENVMFEPCYLTGTEFRGLHIVKGSLSPLNTSSYSTTLRGISYIVTFLCFTCNEFPKNWIQVCDSFFSGYHTAILLYLCTMDWLLFNPESLTKCSIHCTIFWKCLYTQTVPQVLNHQEAISRSCDLTWFHLSLSFQEINIILLILSILLLLL